jgi:serine/threonine-protein kinase
MWRIKKLDAIENIGEIYDYSTEEDTIYIIMEYVRGNSLSSIIKKNSFLTLTETLYILEKVLKVLDSLHNFKIIGQKEEKGKQNSIIHRDLKPDNIMVSLDKTEIKLIDFGISTSILFTKEKSESLLETSETDIYGTYAYLNPQVLEMKGKSQKEKENLFLKIGVQFDIYAVGVIFYEMLTGKKPFIEDNYDDIKTIFDAKNYDIPFISRYNEEIYPFIENMIIKMLNTSKRESKYNEYEYFGDKLPIYLNVSEILKDIRKVNELIKKNPKSPELYPPLLKPEFEDRNLLIRNLEIFNLKNVKFKWFEKTL